MPIREIVTGGFGNGTFNGLIESVVLRGYRGAAVLGRDVGGVHIQADSFEHTAAKDLSVHTAQQDHFVQPAKQDVAGKK